MLPAICLSVCDGSISRKASVRTSDMLHEESGPSYPVLRHPYSQTSHELGMSEI